VGIPTVADRIAQTVVKRYLELLVELASTWTHMDTGPASRRPEQYPIAGGFAEDAASLDRASRRSLDLHPTLGSDKHASNLILQLEPLLLEPFEHFVGSGFFLRLDTKDLVVDLAPEPRRAARQMVQRED
jgi:hypothetical protein